LDPEPGNLYGFTFLWFLPLVVPNTSGLIIAILLVVLLLICSALISSSEVAFFSLSPNEMKELKEEQSPEASRILNLREKPRTLLATILISNNFINIAIAIISSYVIERILSMERMEGWAKGLIDQFTFLAVEPATFAKVIHFIITVGGVTFLLVLFGEVVPKIYARLNNMWLAKRMSGILSMLLNFFNPVSGVMVKATNIIERRLMSHAQNTASREEIDQAIELTVKEDQRAVSDIDILKGIVKLADVSVTQIMKSRVDVVAVDFRISFGDLLKVIREKEYSRIPVYDENFDNITGILYVKDLINHLDEADDFEWQPLIRTNVFYVPEAKKINDLLREFQEQRLHMAIVVDEYGGSTGIVTLEDIMEEVIGEIKDEFDDDIEVEYVKLDEYNYMFEGKTLLNDVCRVIGVDTTTFDEVRGDADSVAGLILEVTGQFPKAEQEIHYNDFVFKVVTVSKRRIEQIRITIAKK
jgi:putative hemolysin